MHRDAYRLGLGIACLLAVGLVVWPVFAGTQDFTLVNRTGVDIYSLFISESANNDWEEDVLGQDVLPDGARVNISFRGRTACLWDMMVTDSVGDSLEWAGINLCEASVVVLSCDDEECWAEWE